MHRARLPGALSWQHGAIEGHAAIAVECLEVLQAGGRQAHAHRRALRQPGHEGDAGNVSREFRRARLGVEALAQRCRSVEHRLRRNAPGRGQALHAQAVPGGVALHGSRVRLGQALPFGRARQAELRIGECSLQLQEAGHLGHPATRFAVLEQRAERCERIAKGVVAAEHLHRRPGAAIGRAQHQQPRARPVHESAPDLGPLELHRARQHAPHRVREDAHRLPRAAARLEGGIDRLGQAAGFVLHRAAPVVAKGDDLVAVGKVLAQRAVDALDRAVGRDGVGPAGPAQAVEIVEEAPRQPHAPSIHREIAAQDPGQQEQRGPRARGHARCPCTPAHAAGVLPAPRERSDGAEGRGAVLREARHHRLDRAGVDEVVEVRDRAPAVEEETRLGGARAAAVHRAGLDHEVVVGPVEGVGQQGLEPRAQGVALEVARHHAQLPGQRVLGTVQPLHEGTVGQHRLQARQCGGVEALAGHVVEELDQRRQHRDARQLEQPLEHRQIRVEPLGGEQGAARRAGHAHHALDPQLLGGGKLDQLLELGAVRGIVLAGEPGGGVGTQGLGRAGARQCIAHQPAARVGEQVHSRALGHHLRQAQCVLDRRGAQRAVVERVHPAAVVFEQALHGLGVLGPELAEGAGGLDEGAVHQHQDRCVCLRGRGHCREPAAAVLESRQSARLERVHALLDLSVDLGGQLVGGDVGRLAAQDLEGLQQHLAEQAAGATGSLRRTGPRQPRRHRHALGRTTCLSSRLGLEQELCRGRVEAQLRPIGEAQHHQIGRGVSIDPHLLARTAARTQADAHVLGVCGDPSASRAPFGLAGHDEADAGCGLRVLGHEDPPWTRTRRAGARELSRAAAGRAARLRRCSYACRPPGASPGRASPRPARPRRS